MDLTPFDSSVTLLDRSRMGRAGFLSGFSKGRLGRFVLGQRPGIVSIFSEVSLVAVVVKELIDAGVHFGHRASRWNPKMKPYIYGKKNLIHIIDLKETVRGLLRASKYFERVAGQGGLILFVGTKRQAAETIIEECQKCVMPYVTERWLGGTLTNFRTIRSRLARLEELETILESEQAATYSKKMIATLTRERRKIERNLHGVRTMTRPPEALFVVDPRREHIAVSEARKLGIKVVALLDTDCDPDLVDLPVPGNDDSMRSIELVIRHLCDAIARGKASIPQDQPAVSEGSGSGPLKSSDRRDRKRAPLPRTEAKAEGGPVEGSEPVEQPATTAELEPAAVGEGEPETVAEPASGE